MKEIMLTGSGGQGMILAGIILAKAGIRDGKFAVQTQVYGPEARGGASRAEVIIDNDEIDYPKVVQADVLLAMTQEAVDKFSYKLRPGGILVVDPMYVLEVPAVDGIVHRVNITQLSKEVTGRPISANIVALGVLNAIARLVSDEALLAAVLESVPRGSEAVNQKALEAGAAAVSVAV